MEKFETYFFSSTSTLRVFRPQGRPGIQKACKKATNASKWQQIEANGNKWQQIVANNVKWQQMNANGCK